MYSQANVREESELRPPTRALPSVIVDTEKVLREADGPEESDFHEKSASGGKVIAPGCASKNGRESRRGARRSQAIISRLPGCDGQAADAVSAYTQVKMEDAHKLFKIPKSECSDIWIRLPRHKWPKSWYSMEDPIVPLERNLYGHPLAGLLWERQFEKILLKHGWEKIPNWECLFVHREKGLFLSVYVDVRICHVNSIKTE